MIQQILLLILNQLEVYIGSIADDDLVPPHVVAGNIGLSSAVNGSGGSADYMNDKIVVSIVNIMEEAALKNGTPYRSASLNPETENPPVFINLFLLFTANYNTPDASGTGLHYYRGLSRLSRVIEFFQGKNLFTIQNSPGIDFVPATDTVFDAAPPELQDVSIEVELVSLTFEQSNYLWGSLGGKQLPFVLYKAHVLPITRRQQLGRGSYIQDIHSIALDFSPAG